MTKGRDIRCHAINFVRGINLNNNPHDCNLVSMMCSVSLRSVVRWIEAENLTGSFLPRRKRQTSDSTFVISPEHFEFLRYIIDQNPALYADEMSSMLDDEFGIVYNKKQIYSSLEYNGITNKVLLCK